MLRRMTTVSTKGRFVIPAEMRKSLGIKPGTRITLTQEDSRIVIEPVTAELVETTRGMLKGKKSLTDELRRNWRREDRW